MIYGMPAGLALRAVGSAHWRAFFPIGWIIVNVIFLYRLQVEKGAFAIIQPSRFVAVRRPAAAAIADCLCGRRLFRKARRALARLSR